MAEDAYIETLSGGQTDNFSPRQVFNKPAGYWEAVERGELVVCACVETPGSGKEYRPLTEFDILPPLDQVPLYAPNGTRRRCTYKRLPSDHPAVIEAIKRQRSGARNA